MCRVGEMRVGEGRTSARPSSPAAGDGDAHVSGRGVASGKSSASKKGGASERSLSPEMGTARRGGGGGDDDEEERRGSDLGEDGFNQVLI
jgi:hypothetical protein